MPNAPPSSRNAWRTHPLDGALLWIHLETGTHVRWETTGAALHGLMQCSDIDIAHRREEETLNAVESFG
jgi:hypothetical protein